MSPQVYYVLHVSSILLLGGVVFAIFGGAPVEKKKKLMMFGGILSLLALVGGFGLATKVHGLPNPANWPLWIWLKVAAWLWFSAIGGIAFRKRDQSKLWLILTLVAALLAIYSVYYRPGA